MGDERKAIAVIAGGCFWCLEAVFQKVEGINKVISGYCGGKRANPTYEQVSTGVSDHAEAVQLTYDPRVINYVQILEIFFAVHDPTSLNRQGNDIGNQYRSAIFPQNSQQEALAKKFISRKQHDYKSPIVTTIELGQKFYPAEEYHQDFYRRNKDNSYCRVVIKPKLEKLARINPVSSTVT